MYHKLKSLITSLLIIILISLIVLLLHILGYGLTYQVTNSMPKGFYIIIPPKNLHRGDIVIFHPPKFASDFLFYHHWIPKNKILMKYIAAMKGDYVCNHNNSLFINSNEITHIYKYYKNKNLLPNKPFCRYLQAGEYLLLSTYAARSFDGRYFGPIAKKNIIGKAIKL